MFHLRVCASYRDENNSLGWRKSEVDRYNMWLYVYRLERNVGKWSISVMPTLVVDGWESRHCFSDGCNALTSERYQTCSARSEKILHRLILVVCLFVESSSFFFLPLRNLIIARAKLYCGMNFFHFLNDVQRLACVSGELFEQPVLRAGCSSLFFVLQNFYLYI